MISSTVALPMRKLVMPGSLFIPRYLLNFGLRKSISINPTFLPVRVKLIARLRAIKLLPSPEMLEVTSRLLCSSFIPIKARLVRRLRNCSAMMVRLPSEMAMASVDLEYMISASTGTLVFSSISVRNNIWRLNCSRKST